MSDPVVDTLLSNGMSRASSPPITSTGNKATANKKVLSPLDRPPFEVRPMHIVGPPHDYNAETDPNVPFTRTSKYKKHMEGMSMVMSKSMTSLVGTDGKQTSAMDMFSSSMVEMNRTLPVMKETFPRTQVQNDSLPTGGVTFSLERSTNAEESKCELDILKAVLNREGYLNRLERAVRTVNKKFKPEIADIMDLVRAASIEVVECIVKWREAKKDHDAAFMWNKVNYMLKMSSDLDYLHGYLAVRLWMGFILIRNPFCVPYPMEEGAGMFAERVLNPRNIEPGQQADGFMIGGLAPAKLRSKYTPSSSKKNSNTIDDVKSRGSSRGRKSALTASGRVSESPYLPPAGFAATRMDGSKSAEAVGEGLPSSFILNSDMAKIRQAELVILKEEEKFGQWARDPSGRLVPAVQAFTRLATLELRKDDKRPIDQPSVSTTFAPHAKSSDIGVIEDPWLPPEEVQDRFMGNALLRQIDDDVNPLHRGGMAGGILSPITLKGTNTRSRRPLRPHIGSALEFNRYRRKKTLGDRLSEITKLREEIKKQKEYLDSEKRRIKSASRSPKRKSRTESGSAGSFSPDVGGLGATSPPPSRGRAGSIASRGNVSFDLSGVVDPSGSVSEGSRADGDLEEKADCSEETKDLQQAVQGAPRNEKEKNEMLLEKIREAEKSLIVQLDALAEEDKVVRRDLDHISKDESTTNAIKANERLVDGSERSREIERKRRLLTEEEGQRKGPPPLEERNTYDYYATKCQATMRGWLTRCYTRWYRVASRKAATCIQACIRGKLGRIKVRTLSIQTAAATGIQKVYRGFKARNVSAKLAKNKNLGKSAILIQRMIRGLWGRKRALSKRQLDKSADIAKKSVDPRAVYVSDVHELARRIQYAIEEPETSSYPPNEVLLLLRIATVIMQQSRGQLGFSEYSYINARYYSEVEGETLTWFQGVKMLNRAERMLKMMRAMAFGPCQKPPRIVQISPSAQLMLAGFSVSPNWCRATFEDMGMGSKFCVQLFDWLQSVGEVSNRQSEFLTFLASSFPDWLPQLYDIQRSKRKAEFDLIVAQRCIETLQDFQKRTADDMRMISLAGTDIRSEEKEVQLFSDRIALYTNKEVDLGKSQESREELALIGMECKQEQGKVDLARLADEYRQMMQSDNELMRERAPQKRADLINLEMQVKELGTQARLLRLQVENNGNQRLERNPLPTEVRILAQAAGEARALDYICSNKVKCFLEDAGVKHADHLPSELRGLYAVQEEARLSSHDEAWKAFVRAEDSRKAVDVDFNNTLKLAQAREIASKDNVQPSDEEMEEERREDDKQAQEERLKKVQFIPDHTLFHPHPDRPRPVIIAIGRDMPGHSKTRLIREITAKMPGVFVFLDSPTNMGLCLQEMQAVLDAKKSIIMMVDHGLTRMTRIGFVKSFEVTVRALIPNPFVVMAVGDDCNRRSATGAGHRGAAKQDLQNLRDCDIKTSLEGMNWVLSELLSPAMSARMIELSAETVPPSQAFVNVVEGFFIMQSQIEAFRTPEAHMAAMSWRFTQRMLADPRMLVAKLRETKRGTYSIKLVQCLTRYLANQHWPAPKSQERATDPLLNLIATYVECFVIAEKSTLERGGMPVSPMSRTSMKGIQSVEVVIDAEDPDDMIYSRDGGGWRMAAAKIIRVALQDLRTLKTVLRVNDRLLNVCAYREGELIYLDTYDPNSSETHVCSVKLDQVAFLLLPNAAMADLGAEACRPPQTPQELYSALAKLLRLEPFLKSRGDSRKRLVCRRNYTFFKQIKTKYDGHAAFIKCYEAALGQLYFTAYLPEYSAVFSCLVAEKERLGLIENADHFFEYSVVEENDARKILPFAIDRLRISPNNSMIRVARGGADLQRGYRKMQGKVSLIKAQGFSISMRVHGGCGRVLRRKIVTFSGVPHIVEVRTLSVGSILIVQVYEPRTRASMRVTIKPFFRRLLLGSDGDDQRMWFDPLIKRLHIDWRGKHEIVVDKTILRCVRKIGGERLILSIQLASDDAAEGGSTIKVLVLNQAISMSFSAELSKEQVIRLLLYSPPLDVIEKQFGVQVSKPAVRDILKSAKGSGTGGEQPDDVSSLSRKSDKSSMKNQSTKQKTQPGSQAKSEAAAEPQDMLHPSTFEVSLESILGDHENLVKLANQLSSVLALTRPDSIVFGYSCARPITLELTPVEAVAGKLSFDTAIRFEPRLKQSERLPTVAGVIRSRRQMPFIMMEEELNALAQAKAEASQRELDAILAASKELESHFVNLSEDDYNNLAGVPEESRGNVLLDKEELVEGLIDEAAALVTDTLIDALEAKDDRRNVERQAPGTTQEVRRLAMLSGAGDGKQIVMVDENLLSAMDKEILGCGERKVFEGGVKTQFRDTKAVWAGHVSLKVFEMACWQGTDGMGRRFRLEVYEPSSGGYYEGIIRNNTHMKSILGRHGLDLLVKKKTSELVMFIAKYKMFVCDNTVTWDGEKNEPGAPAYRIEFETQRVYSEDKVTPINANEADDTAANENKLFDAELKRGKKITRLVRRISNLLMQLTVFEIATTPEDAAAVVASPYGHDPLEGKSEEELIMMAMANDQASGNATRLVDHTALNGGKSLPTPPGVAEDRESTKVKRHVPPTLRVVGYDPRSKKKAIYVAPPCAVLEIAGGIYSPFLDPSKRRELAKIVSDALMLNFPKGKPFELFMHWSGAGREKVAATSVSQAKVKSLVTRSAAETILRRTGKLFRAACRIGHIECVVTLYQQELPRANTGDGKAPEKQLIVNLYCRAASEATEIAVSEQEQVTRLGRTIAQFPDGEVRTAAVRRFLRFIHADVIDDPTDPDDPHPKKILHALLRPPGRDFLTEYSLVREGVAGEEIRPVGCPTVFMPPNTCGTMLHRRGMSLSNRASNVEDAEYLITVYTINDQAGPERGLVIKVYEKDTSETAILHLGLGEMMRLCSEAGEPDLVRDVTTALAEVHRIKLDKVEEPFDVLTERGEASAEAKKLMGLMLDILLADLGVEKSPTDHAIPYLKSMRRGHQIKLF